MSRYAHAGDRGPWHLYVLHEAGSQDCGPCKVGTANNVDYRVAGLQGGNPRPLVVAQIYQVRDRNSALCVERAVRSALLDARIPNRDWYNLPLTIVVAAMQSALSGVKS